ncbi:hypothetical protein C4D60_Mb11t13640 [Musa balbisiana]|uniref:TFIIS N-terminal domain-containing protein n=1 Tax=Musa balbisiana TaxID=52838 RepID=A0A4S8J5E9_MUSBA|nr:hypothetical protein C4D60_Mb11t13640 [Musa balbisiana]
MERKCRGYSDSLGYWRKYFRCCMTNIFDVIRNAFLVASTDNPDEFVNHRDEMVEMIHTWSQRSSCSALEAERVDPNRIGEDDDGSRRRPQEEIKVVGSVDDPGTSKQPEKGKRKVRFYNDEEEEPSDEPMEEDTQIGEVMRIKELVMKHKGEEADDILFELLRQLQTIKMSVNTIQVTGIARALRDLRKHKSKEIKQLFKALINDWKMIVEEEIRGTAPTSRVVALDSEANPSHTNMDEEELFSAKSSPVDLSKNDDDGNVNHEEARTSRSNLTSKRNDAIRDAFSTVNPQDEGHRPQTVAEAGTPKEVVGSSCSMLTESDKLETVKRKLKEGYREAENAKRQRRIQIMEPHELPEPPPHRIEGQEIGKRHYRGRYGRWYRWR